MKSISLWMVGYSQVQISHCDLALLAFDGDLDDMRYIVSDQTVQENGLITVYDIGAP